MNLKDIKSKNRQFNKLIDYLISYGITSTLTVTSKNFYNIDWNSNIINKQKYEHDK